MNNFPRHNNYGGLHLFNETDETLSVEKEDINQIISSLKQHEACDFMVIEVVFVDEDKILQINNDHLNHDYVTDVITFQYSDKSDLQNIEGTLYCCLPQISRQAREHSQPVKKECLRIIIHGLLHLCGYSDHTDTEKDTMTDKEDLYLSKVLSSHS